MQAEIHEIDFRSELPMKNINTNIKNELWHPL